VAPVFLQAHTGVNPISTRAGIHSQTLLQQEHIVRWTPCLAWYALQVVLHSQLLVSHSLDHQLNVKACTSHPSLLGTGHHQGGGRVQDCVGCAPPDA
jgi:hypothetical protein